VDYRLHAHPSRPGVCFGRLTIAVFNPVCDDAQPTKAAVHTREATVLWTIFIILLVLWLLGMVSSYTLGGFIHVLLVIAIVVVLIRLIQGRRPID
jgi:hypothetical protein